MKDNHTPESCPFCGCHEIEKWKEDAPSFMGMRFHLSCTECFCDIYSNTPEEAIKAWNTRAESDLLGECLDGLEKIQNLSHYIYNGEVRCKNITENLIYEIATQILAKRKGE